MHAPIGSYAFNLGTLGTLNLVFTTLIMRGLDQFDKVILFNPVTDSELHTEAHLAGDGDVNPLSFTLGIDTYITGPLSGFSDYFLVTINAHHSSILLNLTTNFNEASLYNITVGTIFQRPLCALRIMQDWGFDELTGEFGEVGVNIQCLQCSSKGLLPIIAKLSNTTTSEDLKDMLNYALYKTGKYGKGELRHLMGWLDSVIFGLVDPLIQPLNCPSSEMGGYQPSGMWLPHSMQIPGTPAPAPTAATQPTPAPAPSYQINWPEGIVIIIIGAACVNGIFLVMYGFYLRHLYIQSKEIITDQNYVGDALWRNKAVPLHVRIIIPIVLCTLLGKKLYILTYLLLNIFIYVIYI